MDEARWRVFWEPKIGSLPVEYEDAFWPQLGRLLGDRFAVGDGATESSYAREWAEAVTSGYGGGAAWKTSFLRVLPGLQAEWRLRHVTVRTSWYAEQKAEQGAFAAFLGVRLASHGDHVRLNALAVGDCELVHLTGSEQVHCLFPLIKASQFGLHPTLVGTSTTGRDAAEMLRGRRENISRGDTLLLMSDAVAAWFLAAIERGATPWRELLGFEHDESERFGRWVTELRRTKAMRNDDVTVGVVRIP